jgi:hypothetical protein
MFRYITTFILLSGLLLANEQEYQLGRGMKLGSLPLYIGGYFSIEYEEGYGNERSLTIDDLAFMVYGGYSNISYLVELEAEDIYKKEYRSRVEYNSQFHIERLYVDYEFNDRYSIRVGKYNSPIGFWNINPINVLRDTTSSPIITDILFPKFTTGVDIRYNLLSNLSKTLHIILQENEDIDTLISSEVYNNFDIDRHYGVALALQYELWSYQFNMGYFEDIDGDSYSYALGSFEYISDEFKILGEVGTQWDSDGSTIPYITYLQYSYNFIENHQAIVRLESYKKIDTIKDSLVVMGYTYRPRPPIAIKGEYQWHSQRLENRLLLSISVLF